MDGFSDVFGEAIRLILAWDSDLVEIVGLSLRVTLTAVAISCAIGLPLGALVGFGRAVSEVGAIIIVGGNINHVTRMMTTTIALETSKGNLQLALALGIVLLAMAVMVNAAVMALRASAVRSAYA